MQKRVEEKKKELEKNKEESPNFTTTTTGLKYENLNVSSEHHSRRRSSIRTPRNHRYFEKVYFLNILNTVYCIHYKVTSFNEILFSIISPIFEFFCSKLDLSDINI